MSLFPGLYGMVIWLTCYLLQNLISILRKQLKQTYPLRSRSETWLLVLLDKLEFFNLFLISSRNMKCSLVQASSLSSFLFSCFIIHEVFKKRDITLYLQTAVKTGSTSFTGKCVKANMIYASVHGNLVFLNLTSIYNYVINSINWTNFTDFWGLQNKLHTKLHYFNCCYIKCSCNSLYHC